MTISIHNPEVDKLAHSLADMRGVSLDDAILDALQMRINQEKRRKTDEITKQKKEVMLIVQNLQKLPIFDSRTEDEILGYDENGLPR